MSKNTDQAFFAKGNHLDNELSEVFCLLEKFIHFQIKQLQEAKSNLTLKLR